jgi:hypothetical protein
VNRLVRVREPCANLFGKTTGTRWRVIRTSNTIASLIRFLSQTGTAVQGSNKKEKCGQLGARAPAEHSPRGRQQAAPAAKFVNMLTISGYLGSGHDDVNRYPVIHTWSYKLAEAATSTTFTAFSTAISAQE